MSDEIQEVQINDLIKEYGMMEKELSDIDELFTSTKKLLEDSSKGTRGNFIFIANQTSNLISIKNQKMNLIKSMAEIKKTVIDLKFKEMNINSKNNDMDENTRKIAEEIFNKMLNKGTSELLQETIDSSTDTEQLSEEEIDSILESRIEDEHKEIQVASKNDNIESIEKLLESNSDYKVVIEENENIPLIIDKDYNLIEEFDTDYLQSLSKMVEKIVIVNKETIDDEVFAVDSDNNYYEIVNLE
jgi:hypothetical protein